MVPLFLASRLLLAASLARAANCVTLADLALQKVLDDGSQIFGVASAAAANASRADWMAAVHDDTPLVHMNIPGTHETSTWNFSQATRDSLAQNTNPDNGVADAIYYRCQSASILDSLDAGYRFFDLRYAFDPTYTRLVFWHSEALMSGVTTVEDVLFGFYSWLDRHPTEALILSFQYEGSTQKGASNNAAVQAELFRILTSRAARKYFLQTKDEIGTLGAARGKITLFRRFDMDHSPASYEAELPGLHLSPANWPDDGKDFALVYNTAKNLTAYVEDYYEPDDIVGGGAVENIDAKFNATAAHLAKAAAEAPDSLFLTFASAEHNVNVPPITPEVMALGNGTDTPKGGVNQQLVPFLQTLKGKRVGVVIVDFWDTPEDLVGTILSM
ncbi:PLC-like phosphodiesterase [Thozetella sp. PMI_491]|nr:PLC-like phosphodiesterase [Thozetella sp. PMI_491]